MAKDGLCYFLVVGEEPHLVNKTPQFWQCCHRDVDALYVFHWWRMAQVTLDLKRVIDVW